MRFEFSFLIVYLLALAWARIEDIAHCDPSDKDECRFYEISHIYYDVADRKLVCPPDPGFASKAAFDFASAGWDDDFQDFWTVDEESSTDKRRVDFDGDEEGVALGIWEPGQSASLTSNKYLFFGKVTVEVQAAKGQGVITKIMLKSDSGNEIDWVRRLPIPSLSSS